MNHVIVILNLVVITYTNKNNERINKLTEIFKSNYNIHTLYINLVRN